MRDGRVIDRHDYGLADRAARPARRRAHDLSLGLDHQDAHRDLDHAACATAASCRSTTRSLRWVPELRQVHDPYGMIDSITLRMLLSHSAGFQNPTWPYGKRQAVGAVRADDVEPARRDDAVSGAALQTRLAVQLLESRFIYLARVIEQITGDPWEAYVQKNIFAPLGLDRSYFRRDAVLPRRRPLAQLLRPARLDAARSARSTTARDFDPGITIPNGGWNAPLGDLAKYAAFLTNVAAPGDVARARYDVVLPRVDVSRRCGGRCNRCRESYESAPESGWASRSSSSTAVAATILGHTGSQAGFRSFLYFNPATSAAIIAAFNTTNEATPARSAYARMYDAALALLR